MRLFSRLAVALLLTLTLSRAWADDTYELDAAHCRIGFAVDHMVVNTVHGQFNEFAGAVTYNAETKQLTGAEATIQVKSINTGIAKRDDHLRNADFFDVEKHPTITFKASKVEVSGAEQVLVGELTMHGVTKALRLPAKVKGPIVNPWGKSVLGVAASASIDRREFGLTWSKAMESGGLVVDHQVTLNINLEVIKK